MHFHTKHICERSLVLLLDFLVSCLGLLACFIGDCGAVINQLDTFNYASLDHLLDGIGGNVHETLVQHCEIHSLFQNYCHVHVFCLVQAVVVGLDRSYWVSGLLKMWQMSALNTTLHPVCMIQLTDTIVIPMSGACRTSFRVIGVEDSPLGTLILRSS